ncbi:type II toxin-antitoxin system MqsA family antitoxin [Thermicanus aegyptius]|uniref:type II toxin-antitoxin system MqsA family antitoxin n=1 Tax=Thermicanus aegyptius TaxID=94009 RepID=UPI0006934682|nr:type II toxin-antitoxin system MqsA family antitoxin [Thermicanus aegyptius]
MVEKFCPECLNFTECVPVLKEKTYDVRGEKITIQAEYLKCNLCEKIIPDRKMQERNYDRLYSEYRRRKNLLTPDEIKQIREMYGLSQRQLSKALGWSHATLSRYENGVLQSINHNSEMALLKEPFNMLRILEKNKSNLTEWNTRK